MRTPIVAGNWKMHNGVHESVALARSVASLLRGVGGVEVVVCPPFTALKAVADALIGTNIAVGGQNCYPKASGAFTGEVAPGMLLDTGCRWVIIGHSERRQYFGESDAFLNEKLNFALKSGLHVMFCIGETLDERRADRTEQVLERQVRVGLRELSEGELERTVIAYEPVWAIGTGVTATPEQAEQAQAYVRGLVAAQFGETAAARMRIQYGGSVKPDNAAELLKQPDVDGALVGGASLDAAAFAAIVRAAV